MSKGNVLVIGNSGVGKSTLINAVLGEDVAPASFGTEGTTKELKIYENDNISFRVIDTVGFEPTFLKERIAISSVQNWSKKNALAGRKDNLINMIWFCVDGTSAKLFDKTISNLSRATSIWKNVPIVVVITKSYSLPDREKNIEMVKKAFENKNVLKQNLKRIIPVVAQTYVINESAFAAPNGIEELIEVTNELMPEGIKAASDDVNAYILNRKRVMAQSVVITSTTAGVIVGAVPIPIADGLILTPTEVAMVNAIAKIYELPKNEKSNNFINSIIDAGTVGAAAKLALNGLKAIPGVNMAASALNAIVAGVFVATIGEASVYLFEQVYTGKKTVDDIDWAKKIVESKITNEVLDKVNKVLKTLDGKFDKESIIKALKAILK